MVNIDARRIVLAFVFMLSGFFHLGLIPDPVPSIVSFERVLWQAGGGFFTLDVATALAVVALGAAAAVNKPSWRSADDMEKASVSIMGLIVLIPTISDYFGSLGTESPMIALAVASLSLAGYYSMAAQC